jgi:integrase
MMNAHFDKHVGPKPTDFVFTTLDGYPVRHSNFRRREFKPAVALVLPQKSNLRFHDLRHTAASLALAVTNGNLVIVKQRLGHEKIETTINIYGHLVRATDAEVAQALDQFAAAAKPAAVVSIR